MKEIVFEILSDMAEELSVMQLKKLQEVLLKRLQEQDEHIEPAHNDEYLEMFINAKKIEGCSIRTLKYYRSSVHHMFSKIETPVRKITTEQLREYYPEHHPQKVVLSAEADSFANAFDWFPTLVNTYYPNHGYWEILSYSGNYA